MAGSATNKEEVRASLFGPNPVQDVSEAREASIRSRGMEWANVPRGRGAVAAAGMAGEYLGRGIGEATGIYQDPAEQRARALQEAQQEVDSSGADLLADPMDYYAKAYESMKKRGLEQEAMQVYQIMQEQQATQAAGALEERKVGAQETTANAAMLKAQTGANAPADAQSATAKIYQDYIRGLYGDPSTAEAQERFTEAWEKATKDNPGTTIVMPGEDKFLDKLGQERAVSVNELYGTAKSIDESLFNANRIITTLQNTDADLGPGADVRLLIARGLNILGADNEASIAATEGVSSSLAKNTLSSIKTSGLGTGQGFTDKDLKFLNDASSGNIGNTRWHLAELARISSVVARNVAQKWNNQLSVFEKNGQLENLARFGVDVSPVPLPEILKNPFPDPSKVKADSKANKKSTNNETSKAPSNFPESQEVWNELSPEDRALWQTKN